LFLLSDAVNCYKENTASVLCEWMWVWNFGGKTLTGKMKVLWYIFITVPSLSNTSGIRFCLGKEPGPPWW